MLRLRLLPSSLALLLCVPWAGCSDGGGGATADVADAIADGADVATDGAADATVDAPTPDAADAGDGEGSADIGDAVDTEDVPDAPVQLGDWRDWAPETAGPFHVGHRVLATSYQAPWHDAPREITVSVWYPTLIESGPAGFYLDAFRDPDVIADAPLAPNVYTEFGGYPVHLHSHGSQGYSGTSAFLMRHFASHGWVAVAPDHVGNLLIGDLQPRPAATYLNRPADLTAALDAVEALPEDDPLAGVLRTDSVLLSGHSYGVYTIWAAAGATFYMPAVARQCETLPSCSEAEFVAFKRGFADARIAAIVPMAGSLSATWYGPLGHRSVDVPVMALSGTNDPVGADRQYETTSGVDLRWAELEGGCHQTFALGGCATLETARGFEIVDHYTLAFAKQAILEEGGFDGLFGDGPSPYAEVVERSHPAEIPLDLDRWGEPPAFAAGTQTVADDFDGVRIVHRTTTDPRPLSYWVVLVDPTADGIDFTVTPDNGDDPRETTRQYTRFFIDDVGATIGINGNFFSPWPAVDAFADVIGLAAADGDVYSGFDGSYDVGVAFAPDGTPTIVREAEGSGDVFWTPPVDIDDAVGAQEQILTAGEITGTWDDLHPRTGIGVTADERLVLLVVDGRQEGVSEGMTTPEMAAVMAEFGAVDAINLDGGGSSTLAVADPRASVRNVTVGYQFPGTERDNGNNLAIFAGPRRWAIE